MKIKYIYFTIIISILLSITLTKPRSIDRLDSYKVWYYIMWITGIVWMIIMTWQVLLGMRNVRWRHMSNFFAMNNLHKWLWIWSFTAIIVHPIAVVISYMSRWIFAFTIDLSDSRATYISLWKIARDIIMVVFITSVVIRKFLKYKIRHSIHLLTYIAIILIWIHWFMSWTLIKANIWLYIYWIMLWVILALAIIYRILNQFWIWKIKWTTISNTPLNQDINELKIQLNRDIKYIAWQFAYIQIWNRDASHPFTIADYDNQNHVLTIAYKRVWQYTSRMNNIKNSDIIYIDWPYWTFWQIDTQKYENIICIAWGIGITPFLSISEKYSNNQNFQLIYLNQYYSDDIYHKKLVEKTNQKIIYIYSREQNDSNYEYNSELHVDKRLNSELIDSIISSDIKISPKTIYLLCWSASVVWWVTDLLLSKWVSRQNIDYEPFNM